MTLEEGDEPLPPKVIADKASALACLSGQGRLLVFGIDELKVLSNGGRGVILMELEPKEKLLAAQPISQRGVIVTGIGRGGKAAGSGAVGQRPGAAHRQARTQGQGAGVAGEGGGAAGAIGLVA